MSFTCIHRGGVKKAKRKAESFGKSLGKVHCRPRRQGHKCNNVEKELRREKGDQSPAQLISTNQHSSWEREKSVSKHSQRLEKVIKKKTSREGRIKGGPIQIGDAQARGGQALRDGTEGKKG